MENELLFLCVSPTHTPAADRCLLEHNGAFYFQQRLVMKGVRFSGVSGGGSGGRTLTSDT